MGSQTINRRITIGPGGGGTTRPVFDPGGSHDPTQNPGAGSGGGGGAGGGGGWAPVTPGGGPQGPTRYPSQQRNDFVPTTPGAPITGGQYGFWGPAARYVAGPSGLQQWAASQIGGLFGSPQGFNEGLNYLRQAFGMSGQMPTGRTLATDEAMRAAKDAYTKNIMPDILQQNARMGLSRSTGAENAVAKGWAQMQLPLIQQALQREENAINRQVGTGMQLGQLMPGLGMQEANRQANILNQAMQFGGIGRGIAQEANNALYEDFLRRQALWEDLWKVPMGQASSTFGQSTRTKTGGLFK